MDFDFNQWVQLLVRWTHVFAGIMWVGTTFFFTWLDGRFTELAEHQNSQALSGPAEKQVWMVHSGGFYLVEKLKAPAVMPEKFHWFRWEAAITWLSGVLLFILVYYQGGLMLSGADGPIPPGSAAGLRAAGLSMALLAASWPVYDVLWFRLLKNGTAALVISFLLVVALSFFLSRLFTGRAAYLQLGGMFGTIMALNVWLRILPTQRRMVAALKAGQAPDQAEALQAKACSKHNTFLAVPVVFLMISNHFPTITYGQKRSWLILSALVLAGWAAAKLIRRA